MAKLPFNHSPRLASRFARLHRIKRKHRTPTDKASLRQAGIEAIAQAGDTFTVEHIRRGKHWIKGRHE